MQPSNQNPWIFILNFDKFINNGPGHILPNPHPTPNKIDPIINSKSTLPFILLNPNENNGCFLNKKIILQAFNGKIKGYCVNKNASE